MMLRMRFQDHFLKVLALSRTLCKVFEPFPKGYRRSRSALFLYKSFIFSADPNISANIRCRNTSSVPPPLSPANLSLVFSSAFAALTRRLFWPYSFKRLPIDSQNASLPCTEPMACRIHQTCLAKGGAQLDCVCKHFQACLQENLCWQLTTCAGMPLRRLGLALPCLRQTGGRSINTKYGPCQD